MEKVEELKQRSPVRSDSAQIVTSQHPTALEQILRKPGEGGAQ
jgi:hypothetical protein